MSNTATKYPNVHVKLVGEDGNAFAIMSRVTTALKEAGVSKNERDKYVAEATSGDYDNLLRVTLAWVDTTSREDDEEDDYDKDDEADGVEADYDSIGGKWVDYHDSDNGDH